MNLNELRIEYKRENLIWYSAISTSWAFQSLRVLYRGLAVLQVECRYVYRISKSLKYFSYHCKFSKIWLENRYNLTPIKTMLIVFAGTWQIYLALYCTKILLTECYRSNHHSEYTLILRINFLKKFYKVSKNLLPKHSNQIFSFGFEKAQYFSRQNLSTEGFWHEFQKPTGWMSSSLELYITRNLQLILANW